MDYQVTFRDHWERESGASTDTDGDDGRESTPLHIAAFCGNLDAVLRILSEHGSVTSSSSSSSSSTRPSNGNEHKKGSEELVCSSSATLPTQIAPPSAATNGAKSIAACVDLLTAPDEHGCTPLHDAARSGVGNVDICRAMVECLLTALANGKATIVSDAEASTTPMVDSSPVAADSAVAEEPGAAVVFDSVINAKCDSKRTPLHEACKFGNAAVVEYLLSLSRVGGGGGEVLPSSLFMTCCPCCDPWLDDEKGRNCLHLAAANGQDAVVGRLLQTPPPPLAAVAKQQPATLSTAGGGACSCSSVTSVRRSLLDAIALKDRRGYTALHLAAARGHLGAVKRIVERFHELASATSTAETGDGAMGGVAAGECLSSLSLSSSTCPAFALGRHRDYPLHAAASNGHAKTIAYLYHHMLLPHHHHRHEHQQHTNDEDDQSKRIINTRDAYGRTPFFLAVAGDWVEAMATLKAIDGCDTTIPNNKGKLANA